VRLRAHLDHSAALALSGGLLGAHFLLWVKAFELTDYASNLILLVVQPMFSASIDARAGRGLPRGAALALALAALGLALVAGGDVTLGVRALWGDAFSIVAGAMIALFYAVSREARNALPLDVFIGVTFCCAALVALPIALFAAVPLFDLSARSWAWIVCLVFVTTLGGHGLMNLAARSLSLFVVNLAIVLEPLLAIGMGALLFGAQLRPLQAVGGLVLSVAVVLGLRASPPSAADAPHAIE
jgi:drug/metabolite transporter (DMT)-like permease